MTYFYNLLSFHIIEKINGKRHFTWIYPTIAEDLKHFVLDNCHHNESFVCLRKQKTWVYALHGNGTAIVILSKDFEPDKYKALGEIIQDKYSSTKNPVDLVLLFVNLKINGRCAHKSLAVEFKNYTPAPSLRSLIQEFDLEVILFYTTILLKRRMLILSPNLDSLFKFLGALTKLVPNRSYQEYLHPVVSSPAQLRGLSFFVAGTKNPDLIREERLYDLFLDLSTKEFRISPKSGEILTMSKVHKELAVFLVKLSKSELEEKELGEQIMAKTREVISMVHKLVPENNGKMLTSLDLKTKSFHPATENFFFHLALSENIMML